MKKTLIIFLILTVTSTTNATTWEITSEMMSPAYEITVSVVDNPGDICLALAVDNSGILSNFVAGPDAPENSSFYGTMEDYGIGDLGQGEVWGMEDYTPPDYIYNDGDWLTCMFEFAPGEISATISLYWLGDPPIPLTSHTVGVPEPMTLSLLALGGLLLCRRK